MSDDSQLENAKQVQADPYTFDRVMRIAVACFMAWALVSLAAFLSDVLIPFGIAVLLAYLLNPLVNLVQKKIPNRSAAVFLSLAAVSIACCGACYAVVAIIYNEMAHFAELLGQMAEDQQWKEQLIGLLPQQIVDEIQHTLSSDGIGQLLSQEGAWEAIYAYAASVMPWLQDLGLGVLGLLGLSVVALYVVFLLIDYDWFLENWQKIVPPKHRDNVDGFVHEFNGAMHKHFRAQAVISFICAVLYALGFSIIGLPMAVLFGLFVGLLNMIPYVQILTLVPAALLAIMQSLEGGSGLGMCLLLVLLVYAVVQVIQDAILVPRIMGEAFGLRPFVILLSIMIWGKLLGLLGLIIALPLTCLAWAWYQRLVLASSSENVD